METRWLSDSPVANFRRRKRATRRDDSICLEGASKSQRINIFECTNFSQHQPLSRDNEIRGSWRAVCRTESELILSDVS